jgi:AraC-like DNA-binding protein
VKPIIERLNKEPKSSFVLQKDICPYYPTPWHYHPEYELVLVLKSFGKKNIGDHLCDFSDGDLTFLGPFLPHVYRNDNIYYEENSQLKAEAIVIHFAENFAGSSFFNMPEMESIKKLLENSVNGFSITGKTRQIVAKKMSEMFKLSGPLRIIELLSILNILAETEEKEQIASPGYIYNFKTLGSERITIVCDYIMRNFASDLTLAQVAKIANMSPNSFCSFFKQRTRKTFVSFLNEVRVGYACRLLSEDQYNISEICYISGFQNLSNFNRQFKTIQNKTPIQYRRKTAKIKIFEN